MPRTGLLLLLLLLAMATAANAEGRRSGNGQAAVGVERRSRPLRRAARRRRLWRLSARALHDGAQPCAAARRSRRRGGADAGRGDPVARPRHGARRGRGRQMVPARGRAGRARSAVPVRADAARRAFRQEGRAGRLCADAGGGRSRQPAGPVQSRAAAHRARAGRGRHDQGGFLLRAGRQGRSCRTRNMRWRRSTPTASAARSATRPRPAAGCCWRPGRISTPRSSISAPG